ncbi:MAG: hypothetical protein AAGB29_07845 [Planctomycetota bacterium]
MSIELTCDKCGKLLRVDDKFAGRRASCPACRAPIDIPAKADDELEELEELEPLDEAPAAAGDADDSGYALDDDALGALAPTDSGVPQPMTQAEKLEAAGLAAPAPTKGKAHGAKPLPGHTVTPELTDREKASRAAARRSLIVKGVLALVVLAALVGGGYLYMTTLGAMVKVVSSQSVRTVVALDDIDTADTNQTLSTQVLNPMQAARTDMTMGGDGGIYVTRPDGGGDYLLVELTVREGLMKSRNQWSGYNVRFRESEFEVVANTGQTVQPIMLRDKIPSPAAVSLDKGSSPDPVLPAGYTPAVADYESKGRYEKAAGTLVYDGSNGVTGEVNFRALRPFNPAPGVSGVTVNGSLELRDPSGITLDYTYNGYQAEVAWPADSTGWKSSESYLLGSVTTMELHPVALLIPKPAGATKLTIRMGGEDLVTVSTTASTGTPSAPPVAPSAPPTPGATPPTAIASAAVAGAAPPPAPGAAAAPGSSASSNPNPLGYFSALAQARNKARGVAAASNMRQFGIALQAFRAQNGNQYPESLDELRDFIPSFDELMKNPHTGEDVGFIYEAPDPTDNPATTPILWESRGGYKDLSGYVLYADGRVDDQ